MLLGIKRISFLEIKSIFARKLIFTEFTLLRLHLSATPVKNLLYRFFSDYYRLNFLWCLGGPDADSSACVRLRTDQRAARVTWGVAGLALFLAEVRLRARRLQTSVQPERPTHIRRLCKSGACVAWRATHDGQNKGWRVHVHWQRWSGGRTGVAHRASRYVVSRSMLGKSNFARTLYLVPIFCEYSYPMLGMG